MTELDHVDYRLPTTVVPSRYDLRLEPDLDTATFRGEETVTVDGPGAGDGDRAQRGGALRSSPRVDRATRRARGRGERRARRGRRARAPRSSPRPSRRDQWRLTPPLHGNPERSPPRLLPQHLQGRRRASPTRSPPPSSRRPTRGAAFPCWDEPAAQGGVRRDARGPGGARRHLQHGGGERGAGGTGAPGRDASPTRIRMSTYLVAFVVGELEATPPVMVGPDAAARLVRAGQDRT